MRRLAALLPALPEIVSSVATRLRLSRSQRERLACIAARTPDDADNLQALAYRKGTDCAVDRAILMGADPAPIIGWKAPVLPLKGGEIVRRGVLAGPSVARILQTVERRWIDEGFPQTARVNAILEEELAKE